MLNPVNGVIQDGSDAVITPATARSSQRSTAWHDDHHVRSGLGVTHIVGGVVLGGMLSYLVQHRTQLSAERAERQRQQNALSEARRAERSALLERFIEVAAEAERSAFSRPSEFDHTHPWQVRTQDVMNRLWVGERLIRIQFPCPCTTRHVRTSSTSTGRCGKGSPTARAYGTTWRTTG